MEQAGTNRSRLNAWRRHTGNRTIRIVPAFLTDFTIVLAGVFCAQMLQNFFAERAERSRANEAVEQLRQERQSLYQVVLYMGRASDCLRALRDTLRINAVKGQAQQTDFIPSVYVPPVEISRWDAGLTQAVRKHFGSEQVKIYQDSVLYDEKFDQLTGEIYAENAFLQLIAPGAPLLQSRDRLAIRLAVERKFARVGQLVTNSRTKEEELRAEGFQPDEAVLRKIAAERASCSAMAARPVT